MSFDYPEKVFNRSLTPTPHSKPKRIPKEFHFSPNNKASFSEIFNTFCEPLYRFANNLTANSYDSEDIVSGIFIKLWEGSYEFNGTGSIKRWLFTCTYNACLSHIKASNRANRDHTGLSETIVDTTDTKLSALIKAEQIRELLKAIDTLPVYCKAVIRLSYFEGLNNHQIATKFKISTYTVKNQKARGISLIRRRLNIQSRSFHRKGL